MLQCDLTSFIRDHLKRQRSSPIQYSRRLFRPLTRNRALNNCPLNDQASKKMALTLQPEIRFSLITLACIVLGIYAGYKRIRDAEVAAFEKLEPNLRYFEYHCQPTDSREHLGPKWIRQLLSDDEFFARLKQINISGEWDDDENVYLPFAITNLDDVKAFKELKYLSVIAVGLEDIRGILNLEKISMLELEGLKPSCDFASIGELSQVKDLSIRPRHTVEFSLVKFWKHPSLVRLEVGDKDHVTTLNDAHALASMTQLRNLTLDGCEFEFSNSEINRDSDLDQAEKQFPSLEELQINQNKGLKSLVDFSPAPQLEKLSIIRCENLELADSEISFPRLKSLHIETCHALKNLDGLSSSKEIEEITIKDCPNLSDSSQFAKLPELEQIIFFGDCKVLTDISFLCQLPKLKFAAFVKTSISKDAGKQLAKELSITVIVDGTEVSRR